MQDEKFKRFKKGLYFGAKTNRGVTLYISVAIMSVLLLVSFAVANIAVKSTIFTSLGRESQVALFAADAGAECAMYWDITENSFATSSDGGSIDCFGSGMDSGTSMYTGLSLADFGSSEEALIGGGGDDGEGGASTISRVNAPAMYSSSNLSNTIPSNTFNAVAGNLVVAAIGFISSTTTNHPVITSVTDTAGNNYIQAVAQSIPITSTLNLNRSIWYAIINTPHSANRVTANLSVSTSHGSRVIHVAQYSGINVASPLGVTTFNPNYVTTATVTSPPFIPATSNELIIATASVSSSMAPALEAGSGYTLIPNNSNNISILEEKIISSQESMTASASKPGNTTDRKFMVVATFKASTSGGSGAGPTSRFGFKMNLGDNPTNACSLVTVNKKYVGNDLVTTIKSKGYNTCNTSDPRRVERGVELVY